MRGRVPKARGPPVARRLGWHQGRRMTDVRRPSPAAYLSGEGMRPPQPAHISAPERPSALSTPHMARNSAIARVDDALAPHGSQAAAVVVVPHTTMPTHGRNTRVGAPGVCYHARRARGTLGSPSFRSEAGGGVGRRRGGSFPPPVGGAEREGAEPAARLRRSWCDFRGVSEPPRLRDLPRRVCSAARLAGCCRAPWVSPASSGR